MAEKAGRQRRKDVNPDEIVDAALAEFSNNGFAAARVDDIARRAGISKGAVYLYFPSKEALFEAVVRRHVVPRVQRIAESGRHSAVSAEAGLRMVIEGLYRELAGGELRYIMRLLISEGARFPHLVTFYYNEVISRGLAAMRGAVERGVASGEFRPTAVADFPQVIAGPAMMAAVWKLLFDDLHPLDLDRLREAHLDLFLNGLRKR